jgi:heat shock protein HslJ
MAVRKGVAVLALIVVFILAGYLPLRALNDVSANMSRKMLEGTGWLLEGLNNQPGVPSTEITLNFEAGALSGVDGCNRYFGSYATDGNKITIQDSLATTRMACEEAIMEQASAYTAMLMQVAAGKVTGQQLALFDVDGNTLATFRQQYVHIVGKDPQNGTYMIDGQPITLLDGIAEKDLASGVDSRLVTRYFGSSIQLDLNGDGALDTAFLLVQDSGGSGTFYFVAAAIRTTIGYVGSNAIVIGDRIAPQGISIDPENPLRFIVNYAERKANEPMSVQPSIGVSKTFKLEGNVLVEHHEFGEKE